MRKVFPLAILLLILIALIVGLIFFYPHSQKQLQQIKKTQASLTPIPTILDSQVNFSKTGNLVNTDPLISSHGPDFSLLYEEPGAPALKTALVFDQASRCDLGQGFDYCQEIGFKVGDRVTVRGIKNGEQVKVIELVLIAK